MTFFFFFFTFLYIPIIWLTSKNRSLWPFVHSSIFRALITEWFKYSINISSISEFMKDLLKISLGSTQEICIKCKEMILENIFSFLMQCKPADRHVYSVFNVCKVFCWEVIANKKHVIWRRKYNSTGKQGRNPKSTIPGVIMLLLVVWKAFNSLWVETSWGHIF